MCGIVGVISNKTAKDMVLDGLEKLEYRGYDSSGIAGIVDGNILDVKDIVRIAKLREMAQPIDFNIGIGHTRWATHGKATKVNAHPHTSADGRFTLVHNGVIENYMEIEAEYLTGIECLGQTDTEKAVNLLAVLAEGRTDTLNVLKELQDRLHGSYAFAIIDKENPDVLFAMKNKSPMLIGVGEGFNAVASDAMAIVEHTTTLKEIKDKEFVVLTTEEVKIYNSELELVERDSYKSEVNFENIELGVYPHYMIKEMNEQPVVVRNIMQEYIDADNNFSFDAEILKTVKEAKRINIIAAGTSMHAGFIAKHYFEKFLAIPTIVSISSEFIYNPGLILEGDLFIFISQSGETADSRAALQTVKAAGATSLTITNVKESTLDREADHCLYLFAGPEIAVASTKAYTAQVATTYLLANAAAGSDASEVKINLAKLSTEIENICARANEIEQIATDYLATTRSCFYIGRGLDYFASLEASLKLKEISYIQTEGFAAGELKHGTISLIEDDIPVICLDTNVALQPHLRGNVQEVKARGAHTICITTNKIDETDFEITAINDDLSFLVGIVVTQYISYYASLHRDLDIDKPRNLAKSVTVE